MQPGLTDYNAGVQAMDRGLNISLPVEVIPEPLVFLADIRGQLIEAHAFKYVHREEEVQEVLADVPIDLTTLHEIVPLAR